MTEWFLTVRTLKDEWLSYMTFKKSTSLNLKYCLMYKKLDNLVCKNLVSYSRGLTVVNMIKESKFNWCSSHKIMLSYYNFHQKKTWLIMAIPYLQRRLFWSSNMQMSLLNLFNSAYNSDHTYHFWVSQKSSRISLINSSWPELWKINTSLRSVTRSLSIT